MSNLKRSRTNIGNEDEEGEENEAALILIELKGKKSPNFSICKEWLENHLDKPYPSDVETEYFLNNSDLTITQINNWFANKRRRDKRLKKNVKKLKRKKEFDNLSFSV